MLRKTFAHLLLALLIIPIPASDAQVPVVGGFLPDLDITAIQLDRPGGPERIDGVAQNVNVSVVVANIAEFASSNGFVITYEWRPVGGSTQYLTGDLEGSSDVYEGPIGPTDTITTEPFYWALQGGQTGLGDLRITIVPLDADADDDNHVESRRIHIDDHQVGITIEQQDLDLLPGEQTFLRYTVRNDGNVPETVSLQLANGTNPPPARLAAFLSDSGFTVSPGATRTGSLFVQDTGDFSPVNGYQGQYLVTMNTAPDYGSVFTAQTGNIRDTTDSVPSGYDFTVLRSPGFGTNTLYGSPGDMVQAEYTLTNTGSYRDIYRISAVSSWDATLSRTGIDLLPSESVTFHVAIEVPQGEPGTPSFTIVQVAAEHVFDAPTINVVDARISGPSVQVDAIRLQEEPIYYGDMVDVGVVISNLGDQESGPSGRLELVVLGRAIDHTEPMGPVLAGEEGQSVHLPIGPMHLEGAFDLVAYWNESADRTPSLAAVTQGFVHHPDVRLDAPDSLGGAPGTEVRYTSTSRSFQLENTGNAEETYTLWVEAGNGTASLVAPPSLTLAPGETRSIPTHHVIPTDPSGPDPLTLHVNISSRPEWTWNATVNTSILPPPAPQVIMTEALPEHWPRELPLLVTVRVESSTDIVSVQAILDGPERKDTFTMVLNGSDHSTNLTFVEAGPHTLSFRAVDDFGTVNVTEEQTFMVDPVVPPQLSWDAPKDGSEVTHNHTITVQVSEPGAVKEANLTIKDHNGTVVVNNSLVFKGGNVSFNLSDLEPGDHTIMVHVTNTLGESADLEVGLTVLAPSKEDEGLLVDDSGERGAPAPIGVGAVATLAAFMKKLGQRSGHAITKTGPAMTTNGFHQRRIQRPMEAVVRCVAGLFRCSRSKKLLDARSGRIVVVPPRAPSRGFLLVALLVAPMVLGAIGGGAGWLAGDRADHAGMDTEALRTLPPMLQAVLQDDFTVPGGPATVAEAIDALPTGTFTRIPVPDAPEGKAPLMAALSFYSSAMGLDVPGQRTLAEIQSLGLTSDAEEALAVLVLSFVEAVRLHEEAVADLTPEEIAFVLGDATALDDMLGSVDSRFVADAYDARIADIASRVDISKNLQAADLLARAIEQSKDVLADLPPTTVDGAVSTAEDASRTLHDLDAWEITQALFLDLGAIHSVPVNGPADLGDAMQDLAAVYGIRIPEVSIDGLDSDVEAAIARIALAHAKGSQTNAQSHSSTVLDAIQAATPTLQEWADSFSDGLPAVPTMTTSAAIQTSDECLPTDDPSLGAVDPSTLAPSIDPDITGGGVLLHVPLPSFAPDCKPNPSLLTITGIGGTTISTEAILHIDLGGDDTYEGVVAGPGTVHVQASPVGVEPIVESRSIGAIHLDLGGDDDYITPDLDSTQGSAMQGFSVLFDVDGSDEYQAGRFSQGAVCCTPPPSQSVSEPDAYMGVGGIGLLMDLGGNDQYTSTNNSQAYAEAGLYAFSDGSAGLEEDSPGFGGFLVDAGGDDVYAFGTQASAVAGTASVAVQNQALSAGARTVAALVDMDGDDVYRSIDRPIDPTDPSQWFLTQALAENDADGESPDGSNVRSASAAFIDLRGADTYLERSLEEVGGQMVQVDKESRAAPQKLRVNGALTNVEQYGEHELFLDVPPPLPDQDGDGAPDAVEVEAGTDPTDPGSHPGAVFGSGGEPDLEYILRAPSPGQGILAGVPSGGILASIPSGLRIPGLVIAGAEANVHTDDAVFVVDLGGDDTYLNPAVGGIRVASGDDGSDYGTTPTGGVGENRVTPRVALLLDVGPGNDTYAPTTVVVPSPPVRGDLFSIRNQPSLGGASLGVAVAADAGGSNAFNSSISISAIVNESLPIVDEEQNQNNQFQATAIAHGITQGAGYAGGVGVLLLWDGQNDLSARSDAFAGEFGRLASGVDRPVARSFTVAQGAGLQRGTGILLNLGDGDDRYDATATAYAQGDDGASSEDRRVALAVSQGAGLGGYGFLVDRGGDNRFAANTPLAQGAANQYYEVFESINERPEQLEVQLQLREDPGMPPAVGFLWSGVGDDVYNGTVLVQGAATVELPWQPWNEEDGVFFEHREGYDDTPGATGPLSNSRNVAREGTAVAALVDVGGNDRYMARPPQSLLVESAFAQGAAGFHAVALLLDGSGDDTYHAQDGVAFVQGAGRFGDALLADLSGHDEYIATGQAQGYATDALTRAVRIRHCTGSTTTALTGGAEFFQCPYKTFLAPASTAEFSIWPGRGYELGTWQQNVVVMHMPPSTGMLVDLSGNDQYIATGNAQGAIHNDPRVVAMAGSCQPGLHGIERNFGNNLLFRDYRWEVFPAVHSCPDPGFPDAPHPDFGIDRRPWVERDTSAGPPMTSPVLGLLMDLEGMDVYDYPNAAFKVPLDDPQRAVPKDANDWAWNQTVSGGANADDTMLPQDTFRGNTGSQSQLPERDIVTNDIMGPVPAWIRPFQEQWGPEGYEILLGHDATMDLLLSQLEDSSGVNGLPRPEATAPLLDFTFEPVVFEVKDGNATVSPGRLHVQGTNGVSFTTNITDPAGVNDNVPDQIYADCPIIEAAPACNAGNDAAADHLNEHVPADPVPFRGSPATFDGVSSGNMTFDLGNITLGRDHITVATIGVDVEDWTIRGPDGTEQSVGADDLVMPQNTSIPFSGVLTLPEEIGPMTVPDGTRNLTFLPVVRVEILNITNEGALAAFSLWPLQITADPEPLDDGSRYLPSYEYSHLLPARGVGIDDDNITEAMRLLFDRTHGKDTSVPEPAQVGVELQILDAQGMLVEDGDTTSGVLSLYANVRMPAGQEQEIDRVVFQSNSQRIGRGQEVDPLNNQTGVRSFRFNWTTDQLDATGDVVYQDADYRLVTSVFLESGGIEPIRVESAVRPIRVDNPPQVFLELDAHRLDSGLAVVSPTAEGQDAALRIRITSDAAFPGNHTPSSEDSLPRGYLEVTAHGPEDHVVFPEQYVDEQMAVVPITALCGGQVCLEGIYTLNATVRDTGGLTDHANRTILYDATAPRSWIDMPLYANQVHQKQSGTTDGVRIHWDFTDLHGATPDVSGTREVQIYRLLDDRVERLDFGTSKSTVIRGVAVGDEIRLVPVAVDHIGNAEASCRPGTDTRPDDQGQNVDPLCYQSKAEASDGVTTVLVDYLPPSIDDVKATPEYIIPGETPLKITAISADQPQGSGLHSVFVRFDELVVPLQPDMESNKLDQWSQTDWNGTPNPFQPLGQERRFNYVVTAVDHADNRRTGTIKTLYLDDLDPRVQVTSIEYPSDEGDFAAGRSGGKVEISIHAEDLALQSATIDFSSITQNPQDTARSCPILTAGEDQEGQFADYVCSTTIPSPSITGSGDYTVPIRVTDKAGNQAGVDVPIKVSNDALEMSEWRVMDVDHQGATVAWNTSEPGTSQVFWATTVDALESGNRRATALHDDATTQHRVALTDLEPNKDYVVEAESLTFSGIPNATGRMFFRTDSALDITFPGIGPGTILSEDHIDLHVGFLSGTDPADIQVSVVASGCDSCVRELVRLQGVAGDIEVPIDRSGFGDGQYLVRVVADRLGDHRVFLSEPFTIDNVAPFVVPWDPLPGRAVTSTQPVLVWRVLDTGTDLPSLDTLHVEVDGQEVDTREVEYRSGSGGLDGDPADGAWIDIPVQRTPTGDVIRLEDGETHHAQVRLMDAAGNVATATLDFVVDVSAPRFREAPTIQYHPGPIAGRPAGTVDLSVVLDDPAGVAGARVTFDAWGLDVPLVPEHRAWHGTFAIPSDVDPGIHAVPVTTEDRLGNQEVVGHLDILVDTTAPTIESHNASVDHNVVDLQVKSDEPTVIQVTSGTATWERATFADNHSLRVGPLMPGTEVSLSINASDGAGNVRTLNITVTTEPDEGAPGPVSGLNATVREDGTVLLQWTASMDDSGIASYRVSRLLGGGVNATWESKGTSNTDASPPIGRSLTYQVVPVDLVGNLGPARSVSVFIDPAPPILTNLSVTPDQGGPSTLFTFHVTYIHEFPAVGVVLEVAGSTTPMDLLDSNATSCRQGCTYSAATRLATTDMDSLATKVRIVATSTNGGTSAEMDRPLVWGDDGALSMVDEEPKEASAGALWPAIILIIFVASRRRYR